MYIKTTVTLQDLQGNEDDYEVGAEVEYIPGEHATGWASYYEVGEPDISAPGCTLECSRIAPDPQAGGVLVEGWSDKVEEALTETYINDRCEDGPDSGPDPDEYDDIYADRDDGDYMYGED